MTLTPCLHTRRLSRMIAFHSLLLVAFYSAAQTSKIDSSKKVFFKASTEVTKLYLLLNVCEEHHSMNRDTLYNYAVLAVDISTRINDNRAKSLAALALANSYLRWGWTDSAFATIQKGMQNCPISDASTRDAYFKLARLKALCHGGKSNYKEALSILYQVVNEAEKYKDTIVLSTNINTIGSISIARNKPREAIAWFAIALSACGPDQRFHPVQSAIYVNMANAYNMLGNTDSAQYYIQRSLPLCRQIQNLNTLATALRVQSNICINANKLEDAESALQEMIEIRRSVGDGPGIVDDNLLMVDFYIRTGQPEKGVKLCNDALVRGNIYEEGGKTYNNNINIRLVYYEALAKCYRAIGNTKAYQATLEEIIAAKDSFYEANSAQAIAELRTKYEVQKIENTIIQQKLDLTKKNYLFYGSLLLSILVMIIGWLLFRSYRRKQKLRLTLMQQEEKRLATEAIKNAEEAERKRIAADLHDNLGAYAASIHSNIDQIKIPAADNSNGIALQELRNNSKAIVSQLSDTIWVLKKDALSLTAISDRIKVFIQKLSSSYPNIQIDVIEHIQSDHLLPPSQAFHLFKILQEGINNALRHSGCSQIDVLIEGGADWKITIRDNGRGFSEEVISKGGNGLANMQARSAEVGWRIVWKPNNPTGTQVVVCPTTN